MMDLRVPPSELEIAELSRAVSPVTEMRDILRRLIFQRNMLATQFDIAVDLLDDKSRAYLLDKIKDI